MGRKRHRMVERRKTLGLSQENLAEAMTVETSTVARWERGETTPQPWHRPRLAEALKVSVEEVGEMLAEADSAAAAVQMQAGAMPGDVAMSTMTDTESGGRLTRLYALDALRTLESLEAAQVGGVMGVGWGGCPTGSWSMPAGSCYVG